MKLPLAVRASCLALALFFTAIATAQPRLPEGITHVTTVEGIAEYRLDNGLQVLLFRDPSKATITVNMTYLVGSVDESYGETGMAHLLEHMLFKGSTKFPDILAAIRSRGAQFNGTTSWDRTNYFETFDATDANLEWALDLESDRMINAFVAQTRSRHRDDGRPQRVRARREQPDGRAVRARAVHRVSCGTATASRRSAAAATSRTCRSSACRRSTSVIINPTTPCSSSRAASRSSARSSSSTSTSARFRVPSVSSSTTTRSSRTKTASARSSCAASATCRS